MKKPNVLDITIEFICPKCKTVMANNLIPEEDMWAEILQEVITINAYVQCSECGNDWEVVLREINNF